MIPFSATVTASRGLPRLRRLLYAGLVVGGFASGFMVGERYGKPAGAIYYAIIHWEELKAEVEKIINMPGEVGKVRKVLDLLLDEMKLKRDRAAYRSTIG